MRLFHRRRSYYDWNVGTSSSISFTIGYSGRSPDEFVRALKAEGIDRVVDVRALPLSRRRGFSKTALRDALAANGIDYVHLKRAGNPFREIKQDIERCLTLYAGYLDESPEVLAEVAGAVSGHRAALLCVEHEATGCHRSVIARRLQASQPALRIKHL